jgi:ABC-type glycerol-3-phosphate transport system substrate-binding protein
MKSTFQTILLIVFITGFVIALIVFSGLFSSAKKNTASTTPEGTVVIWGVLPAEQMESYVDAFNITNQGYTLSYSHHDPAALSQDLLVALANQTPPDILMYSSELLFQLKDKLYTTPFAAYPERTFRDTYIDGAQLFLTSGGVLGMPLLVDPLVVYYNRDLLAGSNFLVPPTTWTTLQQTVPIFTKHDAKNNLLQSAIALGTAQNTNHARDILSALYLQTGNAIVSYDSTRNVPVVSLATAPEGVDTPPTAQALDFYTSFSNPTNTNYSWNNALPNSLDYFLAGKSAFYIGRASELFTIQSRNPNLNFDVSELFQLENKTRSVTFGSFIAASMTKSSLNPVAAYAALKIFADAPGTDTFSKQFSLPPTRRDLLLVQQQNPYVSVFFKAALSAFSWPDPDPIRTEEIFRGMITDVTSGRSSSTTAIYDANQDIQSIIR